MECLAYMINDYILNFAPFLKISNNYVLIVIYA